ncbi:hypothetical protein M23134_08119 [Microscilla marina ATCC 23134]|uniref:Uncharacterized protein n=1 Tax=Microscilla marina ATCC 23134 TaxID=313606 RepID=A1ZH26_MICM2|nr:hypothetical protein M23134_08119 [Microscilla marina ATCC 23134]
MEEGSRTYYGLERRQVVVGGAANTEKWLVIVADSVHPQPTTCYFALRKLLCIR